jgi:outer membrane protein OmpA-like peptidoglycan-associated protein
MRISMGRVLGGLAAAMGLMAPVLAGTALLAAVLTTASTARAESGVLNLHIEVAGGVPIVGDMVQADAMGVAEVPPLVLGTVGVDWQFAVPVALDVIAGGGYVFSGFPDTTDSGVPYGTAAIGARFRFLDNREGYANEPTGDLDGNGWIAAHVGWHHYDGHQFGIDLGGGYEWSVLAPLQAGLFARGALLIGGDRDQVDVLIYGGLNVSIELIAGAEALDTDGDGLSDERELAEHGTDPTNPDTDGDGLNDGLEVHTETNPTNPDTDGDGASDGAEDANQNGVPEMSECDPRKADTDEGGVPDGYEMEHSMNCRDPADDDSDRDGVPEHIDECPNTPEGEEVDARGCIIMQAQITLDGIQFAFDSADILPASEPTLRRGLQILLDNPDVRVEIAGHTDNVGGNAYNQRLSRARATSVRDWLVQNGIDTGRMTVRGYGSSEAVAPNETEEGRAQNRRIEFRQLGE